MNIDAISAVSQPIPLDGAVPPSQPASSAPRSPVPSQAASREVSPGREIDVTFDKDYRLIYRVLDPKTGELIEQVPPEEVLRVMQNIADLLRQMRSKLNVNE
jgi:hypothetical protein